MHSDDGSLDCCRYSLFGRQQLSPATVSNFESPGACCSEINSLAWPVIPVFGSNNSCLGTIVPQTVPQFLGPILICRPFLESRFVEQSPVQASVTAASSLGLPLGNNTTVHEAARFDCRETGCRACERAVSVWCPSPRPEQSRAPGTARQDRPRFVYPQRFSLEFRTSSRPRVPANTPRYCVPSIGTRLARRSPS